MSEPTVTLDVREDIRRGFDPFTRVMQTVASLKAGERLLLVASFKPVPLLRVMAQRGYRHEAQPLGDSGDWQVLFERDPNPEVAMADTATPVAEGCGCTATPTVEVDARGLEPPEPLVKILEALATLPEGATLKAHTDRQPMHLYTHLEYRGFAGITEEQNDGSYVTHIRRA